MGNGAFRWEITWKFDSLWNFLMPENEKNPGKLAFLLVEGFLFLAFYLTVGIT